MMKHLKKLAAAAAALSLLLAGCAKKQPQIDTEQTSWNFLVNDKTVSVQGCAITQPIAGKQAYESAVQNTGSSIRYALEDDRLVKYEGNTQLWSGQIPALRSAGFTPVSDGVMVYGQYTATGTAWIGKFSAEGTLVWSDEPQCDRGGDLISAVAEEPDGGCSVFSRYRPDLLCTRRYSADGTLTYENLSELGRYSIGSAIRLEEGYLLFLTLSSENQYACAATVDAQGNITALCSYGDETYHYFLQDAAELDGKVYISAYSVPKQDFDPEKDYAHRNEIAGIVRQIMAGKDKTVTDEALLNMLRQNYTAMLLVCDGESLEPVEFFYIQGSLGGELSVTEKNMLCWEVAGITQASYSPAASTHTIAGGCYVYSYTFSDGQLTAQEEANKIEEFLR